MIWILAFTLAGAVFGFSMPENPAFDPVGQTILTISATALFALIGFTLGVPVAACISLIGLLLPTVRIDGRRRYKYPRLEWLLLDMNPLFDRDAI